MKKPHPLTVPAAAVTLFAAAIADFAHGAALVYEPFDYTSNDAIVGLNGGTGFAGAWTGAGTTANNVVGTGLSFGSLSVAGGSNLRSDRAGNGAISRTISGTAQAALTADNSTIWFSVLMDPTNGDGTASSTTGFALNTYATLIFGDTAFAGGSGTSAPTLAGGNAFGVGFVGEQQGANNGVNEYDYSYVGIQGVAYDNGTRTTAGDATVADVGDVVSFIVGRIDFAATGFNDTLTLYRVTDPTLALPASPFATMSVDLEQANFNIISIGDAQTSIFDEIRIGTSLASVIPEPSSLLLFSLGGLGLLFRRR